MQQFVRVYKDGGISCTDFGCFDSSRTDKCTEDTKMPGLHKIIEKALMDTFAKLGPHSPDLKSSKKLRWQDKAKVRFDTLDLLTWVLIRASGDTLTSVGNYVINWVIDKVVDAVARSIANMDWRSYKFEDVVLTLPEILSNPGVIKYIIADVEKEAKWVCDGIRRESCGLPVKPPDCDFICGEGDDKTKGYKWSYIELFETSDPQDRTGRVGYDKLIDVSGRIEFVSRIFVEINPSLMYSYPKLRKTFAAASVTFNVEALLHDACAIKMLSLISVSEQCPLQSEIYAMLYRFHQYRSGLEDLHITRRTVRLVGVQAVRSSSARRVTAQACAEALQQPACYHLPRRNAEDSWIMRCSHCVGSDQWWVYWAPITPQRRTNAAVPQPVFGNFTSRTICVSGPTF